MRKENELNDLISNAMEIADVITFQKVLDEHNIKYDKKIEKLDELKKSSFKKCSFVEKEKILNEFNDYKAQALEVAKGLDVKNLNKYKAEKMMKTIGNTVSPITKTLMKSALTIAMYQGLYLLPLPLKVGIAGGIFATKRVPKMYKGTKNMLNSFRNGDFKKIPKKVLAVTIAGGIGAGSVMLLNYLAKGSIPEKILNVLPGVRDCLKMLPSINKRKMVLLTTGVVKGIDAYRMSNKEERMFEPIIKGFFMAKGMKIDKNIKSFKNVKSYVDKLDNQGKYEFNQYIEKCLAMKKMINSPDKKVKTIGKNVLKLISDSFETASYLALISPLAMGKMGGKGAADSNEQPQPETSKVREEATAKAYQPMVDGQKVTEKIPEELCNNEELEILTEGDAYTVPSMGGRRVGNVEYPKTDGIMKNIMQKSCEQAVLDDDVDVKFPKTGLTNDEWVEISNDFKKASPKKWDGFLKYCEEHKDELTVGTIASGLGTAFIYFMERGVMTLAY